MTGHWTHEPPTEPGLYVTTSGEGAFRRGYGISVIANKANRIKCMGIFPTLWWSEPLDLPEPPKHE